MTSIDRAVPSLLQNSRSPRSRSRRMIRRQTILHIILGIGAAGMLIPFILMIIVSVSPAAQTRPGSMALSGFTMANFAGAWAALDWPRLYMNSVVVVIATVLLQVAVCVPAAYVLARRRFRGHSTAMAFVLLGVVLPINVTALPLFVALSRLGLIDSFTGLILPFVGSGFGIYLIRQFVYSLPQSMFDAARIDGVGPMAMVVRIVVPNVRPAIAAFAIFSIVAHWNDLFWPSVILRSDRAATVTYSIAQFSGAESPISYNEQMAAAVLAVVPLLFIYLLTQRHLVRGLSLSSGTGGE